MNARVADYKISINEMPHAQSAVRLRLSPIDPADGGDAPDKQLQLVHGAVEEAETFLSADGESRARFERVAALVEGFETPFRLELLATVHWVMTRQNAASLNEVVNQTYAWNERKRQFTPRQIGIAMDCLNAKGWVSPGARQAPVA